MPPTPMRTKTVAVVMAESRRNNFTVRNRAPFEWMAAARVSAANAHYIGGPRQRIGVTSGEAGPDPGRVAILRGVFSPAEDVHRALEAETAPWEL
jgi:hypothetical protein